MRRGAATVGKRGRGCCRLARAGWRMEVAGTFGEMSIEQEENKTEKNRNAGSKRCVVKVVLLVINRTVQSLWKPTYRPRDAAGNINQCSQIAPIPIHDRYSASGIESDVATIRSGGRI